MSDYYPDAPTVPDEHSHVKKAVFKEHSKRLEELLEKAKK